MSTMQVNIRVQGMGSVNQLKQGLQGAAAAGKQVQDVTQKIRLPNLPRGSAQGLQAAQLGLRRAQAWGSEDQVRDAQVALVRAQQRFARDQSLLRPPGFGSRLSSALLTTRLNFGGQNFGASPLVGRSMNALGLSGGAAAGAAAAVVATIVALQLATAGVKAFANAVKSGAESLRASGDARLMSGGTAGQVAGLTAVGLSASQIPQLAGALQQSISNNPMAMASAARLGLKVGPGGPFGSSNQADNLTRLFDRLAGMTEDGMRRQLKMLDMEALLPQMALFSRHRDTIREDAAVGAQIGDKGTLQAAQDLGWAFDRLRQNFSLLTQALAKPLLKPLAAVLEVIGNMVRTAADVVDKNPQLVQAVVAPLKQFFQFLIWGGGQIVAILEMLKVAKPGATDSYFSVVEEIERQYKQARARLDAEHSGAMNRHTAALEKHSQMLKEGTHGGGDRARGAIPSALNGYLLDQAMAGKALRLGAFTL